MATATKQTSGGLQAALLEAQRAVVAVPKASTNAHYGYNYASAEDIVRSSRKVLLDAGLVARRAGWCYGLSSDGVPKYTVTFKLAHPASGEAEEDLVDWPAEPGKGRPLDKAGAAALTSAESYWLTGLLLIPRGDEEMDKRDDRAYEPAMPEQVVKAYEAASASRPPAEPPHPAAEMDEPDTYDPDQPVIGFASCKGKQAHELSDRDLDWYIGAYTENVKDQGKARFQAANERVLQSLQREAERRASANLQDDPALQQTAGDVPF